MRTAIALFVVCLVEALVYPRPVSAQLTTDGTHLWVASANASAAFSGADLVGFVNLTTNETYLSKASGGELAAVNTITPGPPLQTSDWTIGAEPGSGVPLATVTVAAGGRTLTLTVKVDPATQEIVLRSRATSSTAGLRDASWSIAGLRLDAGRLIVPANGGTVVTTSQPRLGQLLQYPNTWQAQMAVYEGTGGGSVLLYSTDTQMAFKQLRTSTRGDSTLDVALVTEAEAPFTTAAMTPEVEWRLKAFSGDWHVAEEAYRTWLAANRPPIAHAATTWVSAIKAIVQLPSDVSLLAPLASIVTPAKTLIYLTDWRADPFDVNYPDYTPRSGEASFIAAAHALGFKVMVHVNPIGVSPGHPAYAALMPSQVKTAESLEPIGWRWDRPAGTPTRFAYISPASTAYRALLVSRVQAGLSGLGADAIHLALGGTMYNDGNGRIDGLTYAQGAIQLHQDLAAALPGVAISSDGENDITYRHHAFARGAWDVDSAGRGHPIATFLFSPHVAFYGHVTQPAANEGAFKRHLVQLLPRGVLPQITVRAAEDLDATDLDNARLFGVVARWQDKDYQLAWYGDPPDVLVQYIGTGGSTARVTDGDVRLTLVVDRVPGVSNGETLIEAYHDQHAALLSTSAERWPAFQGFEMLGLDPRNVYLLDPLPQADLTHLRALPGARVGPGTHVGQGFAHFELLPERPLSFDFDAGRLTARTGVTDTGGDGPLTGGAIVTPGTITAGGIARSGLVIQPPSEGPRAGAESFIEYSLFIPRGTLTFSVGVADAATCSDGVTFRVTANGDELWRQHVRNAGWVDGTVSLKSYGFTHLRLISHPGPALNPACDVAAWSQLSLAGLPITGIPPETPTDASVVLASGTVVSSVSGDGTFTQTDPSNATVKNLSRPAAFTIFTAEGEPAANGTDLTTTPFQTWHWPHHDIPQPESALGSGAIRLATSGGVAKPRAIVARPPSGGSTLFSWVLRLPTQGALRLGWSAGLDDAVTSDDGVEFAVRINGTPYWRTSTSTPGWIASTLDLAAWAGQNVLVELATDALTNAELDSAYWADLVLSASTTGCAYDVPAAASIAAAGGTFSLPVTTTAGCPWTAKSSAPWLTTTDGSGNATGALTYRVATNDGPERTATLTVGGRTVTVTQASALPTMTLDKTALAFGAVSRVDSVSGVPTVIFVSRTGPQQVRLTQSGSNTVTWTAAANQPWLRVTPASGRGSGTLAVTVIADRVPLTSPAAGTVTLTFTYVGGYTSTSTIDVVLAHTPENASHAPFGTVDTPTDNRTNVTGAVPFTGWALDDVEVTRVTICREAFGTETAPIDPNCGGAAQIFVGIPVFIDGARPDVAASFPTLPANGRAGWGFMVLTNMLPNQGNGTYRFHVWTQDRDGHTVLLGTRTLTCANASATLPFGAIDTPTQGGVWSGTSVNFGWALTPQPKTIPFDGSTVLVLIDGVSMGAASYNHNRPDIQALFPGLNNTNGAVGLRVVDTTTLANGLHTISWIVADDQGAVEGIGSRFFSVSNGTTDTAPAVAEASSHAGAGPARLPADTAAIEGRLGWDLEAPLHPFEAGATGQIVVRSEEVSRIELRLGPGVTTGFLQTADGRAPLPAGSHLDAATGTFIWAPGAGFVGAYDLRFVRSFDGQPRSRADVRILLRPKGLATKGAQVVIDVPRAGEGVSEPFLLGGWAADLDASVGTGISTLHAWAYPAAGGPPVFLGATEYGGSRPDVGATFGDAFTHSGFGLIVQGLAPGDYDLAVFAWSTEKMGFLSPRLVHVTIR